MSDASFNAEEDKEPNLSQGWVTSSIGELFEIIGGGTPSTEIPSFWEGSIPWMTSADIHGLKDVTPRKKITSDAIDKSATHCVPKGSIIVVTRVGLGKIALAPTDLCFSQDCQALIGNWSYLIPEYCLYYLSGAVQIFKYKNRGTTISGVTVKQLRELNFPLPPLPEQHRIVAKIEELFTQLDAGIASLKKAQAQLTRYRQAVLKAAFDGRLTQEWREQHTGEIEPADMLLKNIEKDRNNPGKKSNVKERKLHAENLRVLPHGWAWSTVEQILQPKKICSYGVLQPGKNVNDGVLFIRVGDVAEGKIRIEGMKRISPSISAKYPRTILEGNEVLITLVGAIGRTAVVPKSIAGANVARAVGVIPVSKRLNPKWVELWFRNPPKVIEMIAKSHEVARKTLNLEDVRASNVAIPPKDEQEYLVSEIERLFSIADEIEATITTSLRQAEILRQSILKRAFEGNLVPQDPNDEPASVLLERIKAEKASRAAEGKKGKTLQRRSPKRRIRNAD